MVFGLTEISKFLVCFYMWKPLFVCASSYMPNLMEIIIIIIIINNNTHSVFDILLLSLHSFILQKTCVNFQSFKIKFTNIIGYIQILRSHKKFITYISYEGDKLWSRLTRDLKVLID